MSDRFDDVVAALVDKPGVEAGRMFASRTLTADGKVFSMAVKGRLVVKLDETRAANLIDSGHADRFDPGHGRAMKQWVFIAGDARLDWIELSSEAIGFAEASAGVESKRSRRPLRTQ